MKTKSHLHWGCVAIAALLVLSANCPDAGARTHAKVAKPTRDTPPPPVRTLAMPDAYAAKATGPGRAHRGSAAGKRVASSAAWTAWRESTHQTPIFVQFNRPQAAAKRTTTAAPEAEVLQFITEHAELFRLRDPAAELVHRTTRRDRAGGEHVYLKHRYLGVPIWGASIVGHWNAQQGLYAINGRYPPSPDHITRVDPSITSEAAIERALGDLALRTPIKRLSPAMQDLLQYRGPKADLYLWSARLEEPVCLTWSVEIRPNMHERWQYFVDAHSGRVLDRYLSSPSDGPARQRAGPAHARGRGTVLSHRRLARRV